MDQFSEVFLYLLLPAVVGFILSEVRHWGKALSHTDGEVVESERYRIDTFTALLEREISGPLSAMDGYLQITDGDTTVPFSVRKNIALAHESVSKMNHFIHGLTLLHHFENPDYTPETEPVNITNLIFTVCRTMYVRAEKRGIQFKWEVDHKLYHAFKANYDLLETILTELVSNGITYTMHGEVHLKAVKSSEGVQIIVTDTGIGISEIVCRELFQSEIKDRLRFEKQSGLGILLVRHAVRLLGGTVVCTSEFGSGTEIKVTLPLQTAAVGTVPVRMAGSVLKIAVHSLPDGYSEYLKGCGHTVSELSRHDIHSISAEKLRKYDLILCRADSEIVRLPDLTVPAAVLTSQISDYFHRSEKGKRLMLPYDIGPDELLWMSTCFLNALGTTHESSADLLTYEPDVLLDRYVHEKDLASLLEWLREAAVIGDVRECEAVLVRLPELVPDASEPVLLTEAVSQYDFAKVLSITHLFARQKSVVLFGGRYV